MRVYILISALSLTLVSCNQQQSSESGCSKTIEALIAQNDSLRAVLSMRDKDSAETVMSGTANQNSVETLPQGAGRHAITLQWVGWDKPGTALLVPSDDGWYSIEGTQSNEEMARLVIKGKIRRISSKELEFDGIIETTVPYNNGGEPCIKEGKQRFYAKGNRKYYRMQQMLNCEGGNLVDYVDIYPGGSSL